MKTSSDPSVWRVHVNVQRVRQLAHCTFSCTHRSLGSLHNYRTHQTVGSLHVYMHVNVQWPVCLTCACKCAESQTIGSLHISMHISVTRLTPHLYEHIGQSDHCTFACTHQVNVNVKWPVCLTCACKYAESQTIGSLHIFIHTLVIVPTAILHEHIRQSVHFTFTCTHQVHVKVQWPEWLTCACKCAESHTIGSLHIFMHTSIIGPTAQLHERIRQSDHCTFTCTHQLHVKCSDPSIWRVHVNVQWVRHLAHSWIFQSHGSLPIYMNTSDSRISARLHAHIKCM